MPAIIGPDVSAIGWIESHPSVHWPHDQSMVTLAFKTDITPAEALRRLRAALDACEAEG